MKKLITFLTVILFISYVTVKAQSLVGLWEIKEVKVGDQIMTPVAKWTRIKEDHTYESGNGWLQNTTGTWTFDKGKSTFLPKAKNGIKDPFGAFQVEFQKDKMIWQREEEGMLVIVMAERVKQIPMAPADYLAGLWDLQSMKKEGADVTDAFDPDGKHYLFIRWDRIYVDRTPEGQRTTGYWHMNGHQPEITFLSHEKGKDPESWRIEVNDNQLIMKGISDSNREKEMIYNRIEEFPQ